MTSMTQDERIVAQEAVDEAHCRNCHEEFETEEDEDEDGHVFMRPTVPVSGGYCSDACMKQHLFSKLPADDQQVLRKVYVLANALGNIYLSPAARAFLSDSETPSVELAISEAQDAAGELNPDGDVKWAHEEDERDYRMVDRDVLWAAHHAARHAAFEKNYQAGQWEKSPCGLEYLIANAKRDGAKYAAAADALVASPGLA